MEVGRLAKTTSFLVKHSPMADGDEITMNDLQPNRRENMGP